VQRTVIFVEKNNKNIHGAAHRNICGAAINELFMKNILRFVLFIAFSAGFFYNCKPSAKAVGGRGFPDFKREPVRGVWLTNVVSDALNSKENIDAALKLCSAYKINTVFLVVWNRGRTLYPSTVMKNLIGISVDEKYGGRDILRETLDLAKKYNIRVYAWFEFGFSCDLEEKPGIVEGQEILQKKPEWAALDRTGKVVKKNGFRWLNGFDPEVQQFMLSLMSECIQQYPDLTGIQGDDRLPALPSEAGYEPLTISKFANENEGALPSNNPKEPRWLGWKAQQMNNFMQKIHDTLKAVRPNIVISMSPSIFPWSKEEYLQDWPTWLERGWVDMVCPQVYRYEFDRYRREIDSICTRQVSPANRHKVYPGILLRVGDYYAAPDFLEKMIATNREFGIQGEVFFYFEGLKKHDKFFRKLQ
jgi:uncharacterized lipoprotein YddW (UPF0748 family)